jgi:type II secretory pathway pseudopilin PulG
MMNSRYSLTGSRWRKTSGGFTYMGLLILLAIMGIVASAALKISNITHRRVAEEALLDVGREFSEALESYRQVTPVGQPDEPLNLQDLLKDTRFPTVVRHLRKLYNDPITGQAEWGLLRSDLTRRIVGVYSLSNVQPVKIGNFDAFFRGFANKSSYQQWVFSGALVGVVANGGTAEIGSLISPMSLSDAATVSTYSSKSSSQIAAPVTPATPAATPAAAANVPVNSAAPDTPAAPANPNSLISPMQLQ